MLQSIVRIRRPPKPILPRGYPQELDPELRTAGCMTRKEWRHCDMYSSAVSRLEGPRSVSGLQMLSSAFISRSLIDACNSVIAT